MTSFLSNVSTLPDVLLIRASLAYLYQSLEIRKKYANHYLPLTEVLTENERQIIDYADLLDKEFERRIHIRSLDV